MIVWSTVLAVIVAVQAIEGGPLVLLNDDRGGNSSDVTESVLIALDVVPDGVVPCTRGCGEVHVLVGISVCFSDAEIGAVLDELYRSVVSASSNQFFFNDRVMPRAFEYGAYLDGSCSAKNRRLPTVVFDNLKPQDKLTVNYDLFVNIAKNKGVSFTASLAKNKFKVDATLELRVCSGSSCPSTLSTSELVVGSISRLCDLSDDITTAMYCSEVADARPWTYRSDQRKLQCGCTCSGGKVPIKGACVCPGDLVADASGVCGCSCGRVATSDNRCVCPGGRVFVNDACVCPSGTHVEAGVCVSDCFWSGGLPGGSVCAWKSAKSALRLVEDCALNAPVPKSSSTLGSPSSSVSVTVTATKRGATSGQTKAASWLSCAQKPSDLEDQISLTAFGVHDLSMTIATTDNRYSSKCLGCVAVIDAFPPAVIKACTTNDDRQTPATFSTAELMSVITAETAFGGFYNPVNVQNNGVENANGDNKRCDESTALVTDFFETSAKPLASLDSKCFANTLLTELLGKSKQSGLAFVAETVQSGATASLVCERCCFKSITLRERFRKYTCSATDWEWGTQGSSGCQYGRCLRVLASNIVTAAFDWSDPTKAINRTVVSALPPGTNVDAGSTVIHRSIECTKFDQGCKVESKLGDLFKKSVAWTTSVPSEFKPDDFVYWRYKSSGSPSWKPWSDTDVVAFVESSTQLFVQAWSRCGIVHEAAYTVKLHPHSPRDTCNNFAQRFVANSPSASNMEGGICAIPGSDFALLTFWFDSLDNVSCEADTVRATVTDVKCFVTLAIEGALPTSKEIQLPLDWNRSEPNERVRIAKQFALELVDNPTTSKITDGKIRCDFSFKHVGSARVDTDTCDFLFQLTDCDPPSLGPSNALQCLADQCSSSASGPSAFEACSGDVFAAIKSGATSVTLKKPLTGSCCTACGQTLSCLPLSPAPGGVKRCELESPSGGFFALAMNSVIALTRIMAQHSTSSVVVVLAVSAAASAIVLGLVFGKAPAVFDRERTNDVYALVLD